MNKTQVAQFLTIASGFDHSIVVDCVTIKAIVAAMSDLKAEVKHLEIFIEKQTLEIRRLRLTDGIFRC